MNFAFGTGRQVFIENDLPLAIEIEQKKLATVATRSVSVRLKRIIKTSVRVQQSLFRLVSA
jgi:hypothetical protein